MISFFLMIEGCICFGSNLYEKTFEVDLYFNLKCLHHWIFDILNPSVKTGRKQLFQIMHLKLTYTFLWEMSAPLK